MGRHRGQITYFFRGQIGSWRPLEVGLVAGSRLCRYADSWGPPRALEAMAKLFMVLWAALMRELVDYAPLPGACDVGDCALLLPTLDDSGETFGPWIDRFPPARPP